MRSGRIAALTLLGLACGAPPGTDFDGDVSIADSTQDEDGNLGAVGGTGSGLDQALAIPGDEQTIDQPIVEEPASLDDCTGESPPPALRMTWVALDDGVQEALVKDLVLLAEIENLTAEPAKLEIHVVVDSGTSASTTETLGEISLEGFAKVKLDVGQALSGIKLDAMVFSGSLLVAAQETLGTALTTGVGPPLYFHSDGSDALKVYTAQILTESYRSGDLLGDVPDLLVEPTEETSDGPAVTERILLAAPTVGLRVEKGDAVLEPDLVEP